jgi:cation:H+ antiporter
VCDTRWIDPNVARLARPLSAFKRCGIAAVVLLGDLSSGYTGRRSSLFILSLLIGLLMLVVGAEMIVRGGGQLALSLRIPALVVGLTIVAFGTSTPELLVSVTAALTASTEMALANVNGSNIANILLVLGSAAAVRSLVVDRTLMRREIPSCLLLQFLVPLLCSDGVISRGDGVLLILVGVIYNTWLLYEALRGRAPAPDDDSEEAIPWMRHLGMLGAGIAVLVVGAQLFVHGAGAVAALLGLSERFIGLTVVALGTSAPEVVTAVVSAYRGEVDLAVGNSLGSNILNVSMVLGITAIVAPIQVMDQGAWPDMWMAVAATCLLVPIVLKGMLNRFEGIVLAFGYLVYLGVAYANTL